VVHILWVKFIEQDEAAQHVKMDAAPVCVCCDRQMLSVLQFWGLSTSGDNIHVVVSHSPRCFLSAATHCMFITKHMHDQLYTLCIMWLSMCGVLAAILHNLLTSLLYRLTEWLHCMTDSQHHLHRPLQA
jgi:hypothetical protein